MNDDELRRAYAALLARPADVTRSSCLSPESLLALVERRGDEATRLATLDHAMACEPCRRELDLLRAAAAAAPARRRLLPGLGAAAAIILVAAAGGVLLVSDPRRAITRGDEMETHAPTLLADTVRLAWPPVSEAVRYDVEVLSRTGEQVVAETTTDTVLLIVDRARIAAGRDYLWSVRATRRDGSQLVARPTRFRLQE